MMPIVNVIFGPIFVLLANLITPNQVATLRQHGGLLSFVRKPSTRPIWRYELQILVLLHALVYCSDVTVLKPLILLIIVFNFERLWKLRYSLNLDIDRIYVINSSSRVDHDFIALAILTETQLFFYDLIRFALSSPRV